MHLIYTQEGIEAYPRMRLGIQMLHIIIVTLLYNFGMLTPNEVAVNTNESDGLTNAKPTQIMITTL